MTSITPVMIFLLFENVASDFPLIIIVFRAAAPMVDACVFASSHLIASTRSTARESPTDQSFLRGFRQSAHAIHCDQSAESLPNFPCKMACRWVQSPEAIRIFSPTISPNTKSGFLALLASLVMRLCGKEFCQFCGLRIDYFLSRLRGSAAAAGLVELRTPVHASSGQQFVDNMQ